ncbi:hypothetical protein L3V79_03350 [Thiotrichales bacterium 19S9-12]|nr:hypothetical protein [Thiotrichales bacterium 19S9-11]MCF6811396.1 hypothetical protein [Thiotrichales bacterium 19S9-12]
MNIYDIKALFSLYLKDKHSPAHHKEIVSNKERKIIQLGWRKSDFYRDYWYSHGIRESHLCELSINDLPLVDKTMLMQNFDHVVTNKRIKKNELETWIDQNTNYDELYLNKYHVVHTSGTSGEQGIFLWDKQSWSYAWAASILRAIKPKIGLSPIKAAIILATEGRYCGAGFSRSSNSLLHDIKLYSVSDSLDYIAKELETYQPTQLGGYALMLGDLARMQLANKLHIQPKRVVTSGEPLFDNDIKAIKDAWGIETTNLYMASEGLLIGAQKGNNQFDIYDDLNLVTTTNDPIKNICITNLSNNIFPIINYKMGDTGHIKQPKANEKYPKLTLADSRLNQSVEIINNLGKTDTIHPALLEEFYVPDMISFQFKVKQNEISIYYTAEHDISNHVLQNFNDLLKSKQADQSVSVSTFRVDSLLRDAGGEKFQLIEVIQ